MPNYVASMVSKDTGVTVIYEGTNWNSAMRQVKGHLDEVQSYAKFIIEIVPPPKCIAQIGIMNNRTVKCQAPLDDHKDQDNPEHYYTEGRVKITWRDNAQD